MEVKTEASIKLDQREQETRVAERKYDSVNEVRSSSLTLQEIIDVAATVKRVDSSLN